MAQLDYTDHWMVHFAWW